MNIKAVLKLAEQLELKRQGNLTILTGRNTEGSQSIVLAYSYETLIGAINDMGQVWVSGDKVSNATEQHKAIFKKQYGITASEVSQ